MTDIANLKPRMEEALDFAAKQVRGLVERYPDFYPMYTQGGRWKHQGEAWTHWCDGFLPGMLWLLHRRTGDAWFRLQAERYSRPLEPRQHDRTVHDLGFIFMSTYHHWHRLTREPAQREVMIQAGRTMGLRFKDAGKYLCSFVGPESLFIDIMMNVGIIFYAARETGDPALRRTAMEHCLTTRRVLVRGDGSTAHEGIFDQNTGEFLRQSTHQGYRGDSCWSRGLTWSLYGFGTAYRYSRDRRFLETAELNADFYVDHTPAHGVPPWDYDAPAASRGQPDSSAAAIAASGLLDLASFTASRARTRLYRDVALQILETLTTEEYLARTTPGWEGILKRGVYHVHKGLGVDESVMWGEYFFVEALTKGLDLLTT
ncbi:MAG TPA: glycoside hydrolase family 88 protein [Candidatus Methylomirabilis sp.]|nr:glycoside hydrolase family 88 protein [Candidatus Methylomirabilis sp.]